MENTSSIENSLTTIKVNNHSFDVHIVTDFDEWIKKLDKLLQNVAIGKSLRVWKIEKIPSIVCAIIKKNMKGVKL